MKDLNHIVSQIIGRDINWYDYKKLDGGAWRNYFNDSQAIVKNETFKNELNHYIADLIKFCATDVQTLDQLKNVQFGIVALETFKDRLESIEDPTQVTTNEDKYNPI